MAAAELTLAEFLEFLKLDKKQCSTRKKCMVNKRVGLYNLAHGTKHSITWEQVGQSDNYTWKVNENWNGVHQMTLSL
ncbi:MAG: hypothetical protein JWM20_943 [Patescibacteria group bacterium]|nr:hypothetical protein [Patescibacteria group bacterium]